MKRGVAAALLLLAFTGCFETGSQQGSPGSPSDTRGILTVPQGQKGSATGPATSTATGGAPSGSKQSSYIARADAVCRRYLPRIQALEKKAEAAATGGDYGAAGDSFARGVAESEREVAALRSLPAPDGSQAVLNRMYAGFEEANRLFRSSIGDLRSGDVNAFNSLGDQARLASNRSKRIAIGFGFEVCGQPG
jgi:hypothetical protein